MEALQIEAEDRFKNDGMRSIRGMNFRLDASIKPTRASETEVVEDRIDRFFEHDTKHPRDWEWYFGFVRPKQVPHFIMFDDSRYVVSTHDGSFGYGSKNE